MHSRTTPSSSAASARAAAALLARSRAYLTFASLFGLAALGSGILTVANATESTLAILVITSLVLWATASLRHAMHQRRDVAVA